MLIPDLQRKAVGSISCKTITALGYRFRWGSNVHPIPGLHSLTFPVVNGSLRQHTLALFYIWRGNSKCDIRTLATNCLALYSNEH